MPTITTSAHATSSHQTTTSPLLRPTPKSKPSTALDIGSPTATTTITYHWNPSPPISPGKGTKILHCPICNRTIHLGPIAHELHSPDICPACYETFKLHERAERNSGEFTSFPGLLEEQRHGGVGGTGGLGVGGLIYGSLRRQFARALGFGMGVGGNEIGKVEVRKERRGSVSTEGSSTRSIFGGSE